jgi:hypothetical protein
MTLYEEHQAALAELEKARQKCTQLKGRISDLTSVAEFQKRRITKLFGQLNCAQFSPTEDRRALSRERL